MPEGPARPASCAELFYAFTRLALQGFGGVLPVAQRELVERLRWLQLGEFLEMLALAQVLPGPNVVNLALMTGQRFFGWRGALCALAGMLLAPLLLVLLLAAAASQWRHNAVLAGSLRGMAVVAAGLVVGTALKLALALGKNALGIAAASALVAATVLAIAWLRWPLAGTVLLVGGGACLWAGWRLRR